MKRRCHKTGIRWVAASLMLIVLGCIPDPLEVTNIPVIKPELVIMTQIVPDQTLLVLVTKTFGALEASGDSDAAALLNQIAVNDATVTISGPSGEYNLLFLGSGAYGDVNIPFQAGEEYSLRVTSASLGEVTATTTVMQRVPFETLTAELYFNNFDDTLAQITHRLKDPRGGNWYMMDVQHIERNELLQDLLNPNSYTRIFDDQGFEGTMYGETFRVVRRDFSPGDTIAVSLANISEEYFEFMELRTENRFGFVEYLSEPINYPSNIKGGKGFFNLYVPDIRFIVLE